MSGIEFSHTVLLGAAGTGTAFGAACSLRRHWSRGVRIVAMDTNPRHLVTTSLLSDYFEQVPLSAAPEFPYVLRDIVDRHGVDTYLPLMPDEIEVAANLRERGDLPKHMALLGPPPKGSALCADKWLLARELDMHSIPTPRTALASEPFPSETYFLKPRLGAGSRGAKLIGARELRAATEEGGDDWIVQERCVPPEVTVDAFHCALSGVSQTVCRERIEVKSGVATKCRLFADRQLNDYAIAIAKMLGFEGSFCFQVMRSPGDWVVTDVNPRPGAGSAMSNLSGNDFFAASFARAWGEGIERFFAPLREELWVTRQYAEFAMGTPA